MTISGSSQRRTVRAENLIKRYGDVAALDNVSLEIPGGSFVTLLGPSGSGKTTLLMAIAGFNRPDSGAVMLGDQNITPLPPEKRNFGMVFQGYALFPHLTVAENIAFPLKLRGMSKADIQTKVRGALDMVQLSHLAERYPRQLSGGQQQRVALARAIVFEPEVLLLDEPLSALDKKLRNDLQWELKELHRRLGMTFIYVTHDQEEALSMSDDIAIVRDGKIIQKGDPETLYNRPATHFVAGFLGKSNYIEGTADGTGQLNAGEFTFALGNNNVGAAQGATILAIRPEKILVTQAPSDDAVNRVPGSLIGWNYYGSSIYARIDTPLGVFHAQFPTWKSSLEMRQGQKLFVEWEADAGTIVADDRKKSGQKQSAGTTHAMAG